MALRGANEHLARLRRLAGSRVRAEVFQVLQAGGERIRDEARATVSRDTGELARSITLQADQRELSVEVSANAPYAAELEFGNSRIQERPFLRPAVEKHRAAILNDIAQAVRKISRTS